MRSTILALMVVNLLFSPALAIEVKNEPKLPYCAKAKSALTRAPPIVTKTLRLAQVGTRCFTPFGWCWTNPSPVNFVCFCGQTQGFVGY